MAFTAAATFGANGSCDVLGWVTMPAGAALAGYTAFLFNQSPLLLPHAIANALVAGAGALGLAALAVDAPDRSLRVIGWVLLLAAAASIAIAALDAWGRHETRQAERAAKNLRRDLYALRFGAGLLLGFAAPAVLGEIFLLTGGIGLLGLAGVSAMVGLWLYADVVVDFEKSRAVYRKWLALARPANGELRRPIWLFRPVKLVLDAYALPEDARTEAARRLLAARGRPSPDDLASPDWDPEAVWGPAAGG